MRRQGDVTSLEQAQSYVDWCRSPTLWCFAVDVDGAAVGMVGISVDRQNKAGWFWYWMHADFRGRGWTSAAARTVANWALGRGGFERLELGHRANNPVSGAVALAAGFVREGCEREKFLVEGERIDVYTYGRVCGDPRPQGHEMPIADMPSGAVHGLGE